MVDRDVAPGPTKDADPGPHPVRVNHILHVTESIIVCFYCKTECKELNTKQKQTLKDK